MAKRHFPSNYTGKLIKQDPNNIVELESHGCRTPNDYVDWASLSSEVKKKELTKEELELYLEGKFVIDMYMNTTKKQRATFNRRSELGSHIAGSGIIQAFYDDEESYEDKKIKPSDVRFSSDPIDGDYDTLCKALSGEVTTTKLEVK